MKNGTEQRVESPDDGVSIRLAESPQSHTVSFKDTYLILR
jgi:hypothetical protein